MAVQRQGNAKGYAPLDTQIDMSNQGMAKAVPHLDTQIDMSDQGAQSR